MKTASFQSGGQHPKAVAISRGVPVWFKKPRYEALAPTRAMLAASARSTFDKDYDEILKKLDPAKVFWELGHDAVLICWEPFNARCHRRRVAEWLEENLGVVIPELDFNREDSLPYAKAQPRRR